MQHKVYATEAPESVVQPESYTVDVIYRADLLSFVDGAGDADIVEGATPQNITYRTISFVHGYTLVDQQPIYLVQELTERTDQGYYCMYRWEYSYQTY
jgi:hypothetical protein